MTQPRTPQQGRGHQPYGPPPQQLRRPPRPQPQGDHAFGPPPQRAYGPPPQRAHRPADHRPYREHELPAQRSYEPAPQPRHRQAESRNGLGLAAAVVGPIGILFGFVPLTGFVAVICGLVAVPLALAGRSRVKRRLATNGRTAMTGLVSGIVALALGVWGIVIVFQATNQLVDTLNGPAPVSAGPADGASPGVAAFGQRVTFDDGVAVEVTAPQATAIAP